MDFDDQRYPDSEGVIDERRVMCISFGMFQANVLGKGPLRPIRFLALLDWADVLSLDILRRSAHSLLLHNFRLFFIILLGLDCLNQVHDDFLLL